MLDKLKNLMSKNTSNTPKNKTRLELLMAEKKADKKPTKKITLKNV